jgi:hypothetical protein
MKKFTLYQAVKYSGISRYKLEQAVKEGVLNILDGHSNIKFFISKNDLDSFLSEHGDNYRKPIFDEHNTDQMPNDHFFMSLATHKEIIQEKEKTIQFLSEQNKQFLEVIKNIR